MSITILREIIIRPFCHGEPVASFFLTMHPSTESGQQRLFFARTVSVNILQFAGLSIGNVRFFQKGIGAVVVDALEAFRLDAVPGEIRVAVEPLRNVADHVLHEHRVFIAALRDEFLVHPFEEGIDLAARRLLDQLDQVLNPEEFPKTDLDENDRALVVGTAGADLLGAGADRGDRHGHPHAEVHFPGRVDAGEGAAVFHQASGSGDRCRLLDEIGEVDLHVRGLGLELLPNAREDRLERLDIDPAAELVQNLDEPAHVRALEVMGQVHVHVDLGVDVLGAVGAVQHDDGIFDALDADLGDGDVAFVRLVLDVDHGVPVLEAFKGLRRSASQRWRRPRMRIRGRPPGRQRGRCPIPIRSRPAGKAQNPRVCRRAGRGCDGQPVRKRG